MSVHQQQNLTGRPFDTALGGLLKSAEWKRVAKFTEGTDQFNLFDLLEDAVCENAWSRIIHFLFDSSADHRLGLIPLRHWMAHSLDRRFLERVKLAKASTSENEWGTFEGRRLDILVKLLDDTGHLLGVIGIENKVWSGEQPRQLSDYQKALTAEFGKIPKLLVFLTPDKREPSTAIESLDCPVRGVSYDSIVTMCDSLRRRTQGSLHLLVSSLREYVNHKIQGKQTMKNRIKENVAKLYQNAEHREVIELIIEHRPTVRVVLEKVAVSIKREFQSGKSRKRIECSHDFWPSDVDYPPELRIWLESFRAPRGSRICYMLRSRTRKPFIGDQFTVLLNASCENDSVRVKMQKLRTQLPTRHSHGWKRWGGVTRRWSTPSSTVAPSFRSSVAMAASRS